MLDEDVRASCFSQLAVLQAEFGEDVPYRDGLDRGFTFRGSRVPYLNYQKGIYRAAIQRGPACLSINTSIRSPYEDEQTLDGFLYDYRAGDVDQPDNRALRAAHDLRVPIVYFVGTRPGWYRPLYPTYVLHDHRVARRVLVVPGTWTGPLDEREPVDIDDPIERRYTVRTVRARLHQARFRGRVVPAYGDRCAICQLRELRLLDAAHITPDTDVAGEATIANGLSLCTIHHRAFDEHLVAVTPDYHVHVARRLREEEDGPMLDLLNTFHGGSIHVPNRGAWKPDRERLAIRFQRFVERAG